MTEKEWNEKYCAMMRNASKAIEEIWNNHPLELSGPEQDALDEIIEFIDNQIGNHGGTPPDPSGD